MRTAQRSDRVQVHYRIRAQDSPVASSRAGENLARGHPARAGSRQVVAP